LFRRQVKVFDGFWKILILIEKGKYEQPIFHKVFIFVYLKILNENFIYKIQRFCESSGGAKKTRPSCVGSQTVFRLTRLHFRKIGISIRPFSHCCGYFRMDQV